MKQIDFAIPIYGSKSDNAGSYKNEPFDASDLRSQEPLVNPVDFGIATDSYYAKTDGNNIPYGKPILGSLPDVWCRKSFTEKLVRVNNALASFGVELMIWDAYRSVLCQTELWNFFLDQARKAMPDSTDEEHRNWTLNYVSDPSYFLKDDPRTWPTHSTGAAVDLTLRNTSTKELLDMGVHFDDMRPINFSEYFEQALLDGQISPDDPVLHNRRLLHWAMNQEGFVNYPLEFWHFDWGNQMYVHNLRQSGQATPHAAWYGYIEPPTEQCHHVF